MDVAQIRFVSCAGLRWLLDTPALSQVKRSQVHLAGMSNRAVARPLELITLGLLHAPCASRGLRVHPNLVQALRTLAS